MATIGNLLEYVKNTRLTTEDAKYLLSSDTQGRDCIMAALRAHVRPQMVKGGKDDLYVSFKSALGETPAATFTDPNADLDTITDAFLAVDADNGEEYSDIFESMMQFALYEIYSRNEQEGRAEDKKVTAIDILASLFGDNTSPASEIGGGGETEASQIGGEISTATDDETGAETYGFNVIPTGVSDYSGDC